MGFKMFFKIRPHFILIILILLPILNLSAQEDFIYDKLIKHKVYLNKSGQSNFNKRTDIKSINGVRTGEWKVFKNWNEGRAVTAESDSIAWMGTTVGLVRWNVEKGTYQTFDENNGLNFTSINSLALDKNNKLWIAAGQGLAVFSNGIFTQYDETNSPLPNSQILGVCVDSLNRIVFAFSPALDGGLHQNGGIGRFDGTKWQFWDFDNQAYSSPPTSMCTYQDTVWVGAGDNLYTLIHDSFAVASGWNWGGVYSLTVDYQDSLWVESNMRKTLKHNPNGWQIIIDRDAEGMGGIFYTIWNDPRGGLWMAMKDLWWGGYGPYRLDIDMRRNGEFCSTAYAGICTVPGIPGQFFAQYALNPTCQFFASIGSRDSGPSHQINQGGLYKYNGTSWQVFRVPTTILQNDIYGLGEGHNGNVFLSTPFYTQKTNGEIWETIGEYSTGVGGWNRDFRFAQNNSLVTNGSEYFHTFMAGLDFDGYGNLWATYPLTRFSYPGTNKTVFTNMIWDITQPYRPQFMDVIADKNEHIWAAAWYYGGVMYDRTNWHLYPPSDTTLPNGNYDLIFADTKGNIWFGTNQWSPNYGFTKYDGEKWETYYSPQRYTISYVNQIAEDPFGNIWLATLGGLLKYDGSSFTLFDSENSPLSTNFMQSVTVDERGNIWIGTKDGLYVYNPNGPVEFGTYSYTSPVNDFTITDTGKYAKAIFKPETPYSFPVIYQLQRGRGTHKFWPVAQIEYPSNIPSTIEITDSSDIIAEYYYRICEVTPDGKQRFSEPEVYTGGSAGVTLVDFDYYISGNQIFFKWSSKDEAFLQRYEVWRSDSSSGVFSYLKSIKPDSGETEVKQYEMQVDTLIKDSITRNYSLRAVFSDSTRSILKNIEILPQQGSLPDEYNVSQNFPNPFNPTTTINYQIPQTGFVTLKIYDVLGREVTTLVNEQKTSGRYSVNFNASGLASGIYIYQLRVNDYVSSKKMVLLK